LQSSGFGFFEGGIIMVVGSHIFAKVIMPSAPTQWANFFIQSFIGK